jgi:hypothetical protein
MLGVLTADFASGAVWNTTVGVGGIWSEGPAPFGNHTGIDADDPTGNFQYKTYWSADGSDGDDLWVRRALDFTGLDISTAKWDLGVDNGFALYLNGDLIAADNAEGFTWRWEYSGTFSPNPGVNIVAVALEDHGGLTGFDMQITANSFLGSPSTVLAPGATWEYTFSDPSGNLVPAIPEPSTIIIWSLLGAVSLAAGWWRWRKATWRTLPVGFAVLAVLAGLVGSIAEASVVTVTASPLWTNTGIVFTPSDTMTIYGAAGNWCWGAAGGATTGPDGDSNPPYADYLWITSERQGNLIGFVGPADPDLNTFFPDPSGGQPPPYNYPLRVIGQDDPRLFGIGTAAIVLTGLEGTLWLGMNDDFDAAYLPDNWGSVTVHVDEGIITPPPPDGTIPEPTTFIIWSLLGTLAIGVGWWRRRKAA